MRAFVALALLVASAYAQSTANFGTAVNCGGTAATTYSMDFSSFAGGASLTGAATVVVTCSGSGAASGTWTLAPYTGLSATAWVTLATQGYVALNLGATALTTVGLQLTASANVDVSLTITTPSLSVAFSTIIKAFGSAGAAVTAEAGFVSVDASGNVQWVVPAKFDTTTNSLTWTFTVSSGASATTQAYILSAINLSVPNVAFNLNYVIGANANQTFVFSDTQTSIQFWAGTTTQITGSKSSTPTAAPPANWGKWLSVYLTFDTTTTYNGTANLMYQWNSADLATAGIDASAAANLKWAYYDTTSNTWVQAGGKVSGGVVSTTTTHFSQWGMYASNSAGMLNANFFLVALAALVSYMLA